tara:strand:+ start:66 stop:683 length:618 start_codon:yes stop_codon:yes gene_type:complete
MIFKDKITDYVGTTGEYTDAQAQRFIVDGCYDVYKKVLFTKGYDEGLKFGKWYTISNSTTNVDEIRDIVLVKRNGIQARIGTAANADKYIETDSIFYASATDPLYYLLANDLVLLPAPVAGQDNKFLYLPEYSIVNYEGSESSRIENFPSQYYDHVLTYATVRILELIYQDFISNQEDAELSQVIIGRLDRVKMQYQELFGVQGQ